MLISSGIKVNGSLKATEYWEDEGRTMDWNAKNLMKERSESHEKKC